MLKSWRKSLVGEPWLRQQLPFSSTALLSRRVAEPLAQDCVIPIPLYRGFSERSPEEWWCGLLGKKAAALATVLLCSVMTGLVVVKVYGKSECWRLWWRADASAVLRKEGRGSEINQSNGTTTTNAAISGKQKDCGIVSCGAT